MSYPELLQTNDFSVVQKMLKAYSPDAPLHAPATWTGQLKWFQLLELISSFPHSPSLVKRDWLSCTGYATQLRNYVQANAFGACFGVCIGEINNSNQKPLFHAWCWTIIDWTLAFVDYQGTMPGFNAGNGYWIMQADKIKPYREVKQWFM